MSFKNPSKAFQIGICNSLTELNKTMQQIDDEIYRLKKDTYTYRNPEHSVIQLVKNGDIIKTVKTWDALLIELESIQE